MFLLHSLVLLHTVVYLIPARCSQHVLNATYKKHNPAAELLKPTHTLLLLSLITNEILILTKLPCGCQGSISNGTLWDIGHVKTSTASTSPCMKRPGVKHMMLLRAMGNDSTRLELYHRVAAEFRTSTLLLLVVFQCKSWEDALWNETFSL